MAAAEQGCHPFGTVQFIAHLSVRIADREGSDRLRLELGQRGQEDRRVIASGEEQSEGYIGPDMLAHDLSEQRIELGFCGRCVHIAGHDVEWGPVAAGMELKVNVDLDDLAWPDAMDARQDGLTTGVELVVQEL